MNQQHRHLNRSAMSVLEVLIVIGIVALLSLLALPTLNRARMSSDAVGCMSNLKFIGAALNSYAADHNGRFPPGSGGTYGVNFFGFLAPYLGRTSRAPDRGQFEDWNIDRPATWRCPADRRPWKNETKTGLSERLINWDYDSSYGLSITFSSSSEGLPGYPFLGIKISVIPSPSKTFIFTEVGSMSPSNPGETTWPLWTNDTLAWDRHKGVVNTLFADGHVEACTPEQMTPQGNDYSRLPWNHFLLY